MSTRSIDQPAKDLFKQEYTAEFADRWDELIDWEGRARSEGGFFRDILRKNGARRVLDIASGTGFHTVTLTQDGFDVTGADGSRNMLEKARENAAARGLRHIPFVQAEWTNLSRSFPGEKFDAIICLGNAFTHLFDERDRKKALAEIHGLLVDGGIAIIDHRNYDCIVDKGYDSKHRYYYVGDSVDVHPEDVNHRVLKMRYQYEDGRFFFLTMCPIRQDYVTNLLHDTGFREVERYGDFEYDYDFYAPDFIVQVAKK